MAARKRPVYETYVAERHLDVTREQAWASLRAHLEDLGHPVEGADLTQQVLSIEPPWRWVYVLPDVAAKLYQVTVTLRDDGDECHLAWAVLVEPDGAHPTDSLMANARRAADAASDAIAASRDRSR